MRDLPLGTLTLFFSDIEGSTLLLSRLGADWADALSAQREILRACFWAEGGHELSTEGDSFFVVFTSSHAALAAAVEAQRRLRAHSWPRDEPVRVRIGLHTGEPQRHEDGYIGLDVHRAARIAATASGGQIVVSEACRLMLGDLPAPLEVRDLGWHRLKDLEHAEHLFDVVETTNADARDFPPLRSLGTRANLPVPATPLVGRTAEVAELTELVRHGGARFVTLTGPGGTGKTRLALATAVALEPRFPNGVYFVELHTADRGPLMWAGIAEAVGATGDAEDGPRDRVVRRLGAQQALLVLDNLEQIRDADQVVDELLAQAPGVSILATSRRPLHLVGEFEHPVAPLGLPAGAGPATAVTAQQAEAVELFVRRAAMANPRFVLTDDNAADVVELCRRLDGLPLAIELAAARSRLLTPRAMLKRIGERLGEGVTAADRAARQRSLSDTIRWSYDLLQDVDQQMFRRLGVFAGSADLTAIEAVTGFDGEHAFDVVARLVDASLVQVVEAADGEPAISMLHTIRTFARERLDTSGEGGEVRLRHAAWCRTIAAGVRDLLGGPRQMLALERMDAVEEDIRASLDWCLRVAPDVPQEATDLGLELLSAMTTYWYRFGYLAEGRGWLERGAPIAADVDSLRSVDALHGMGIALLQQDDASAAIVTLEQALAMTQRLDDPDLEARESNSLGVAHREAGDPVKARDCLERSLALARRLGSAGREATALTNMVVLDMDGGDYAAATQAARHAITIDESRGDPWGVAVNQVNLVMALLRSEGPEPALEQLTDVALGAVALQDMELSIGVMELFAMVQAELGNSRLAVRLLGTADKSRESAGMPRPEPDGIHLERSVAPLRRSLSAAEWAAEHEAGRAVAIGDAVAEALSAPRSGAGAVMATRASDPPLT